MTVAAIVLCGGTSARMGGGDKTAVDLGGRSVLDSLLDGLPADWLIVCVGDERPLARPVLWAREEPPRSGPLAGLRAGLHRIAGTWDEEPPPHRSAERTGDSTIVPAGRRGGGADPHRSAERTGDSTIVPAGRRGGGADPHRSSERTGDSTASSASCPTDSVCAPSGPRSVGDEPPEHEVGASSSVTAVPDRSTPRPSSAQPSSPSQVVVVLAGDQPFAAATARACVERLGEQHERDDLDGVAAVQHDGRAQALLAAYRRDALARAVDQAPHASAGVHRTLAHLSVDGLATDARATLDVDTPADLERARARRVEP